MNLHEHTYQGGNSNHIYERKYLGSGRYFQRGICKGIQEGDHFKCFLSPLSTLVVDKLLKTSDSNGTFNSDGAGENALYEAELVDPSFQENTRYIIIQ